MVIQEDLLNYLDDLLEVSNFRDYCPNGLQVEGRMHIKKLVTGVSASQALIDAAIEAQADAILVHHGYFWKGENPCVVGMKQRRLKSLLNAELNLLAYHLPLDAHPLYGNNAQLAEKLGLQVTGHFGGEPGSAHHAIAMHGRLAASIEAEKFTNHINSVLGQPPLHIAGPQKHIQTVAWCTGAAQSYIEKAAVLNVDAFVTGEASEQTVHVAREYGIHFYAAGHHATERYGVWALGEHLATHFSLQHQFIDIGNPV